MDNPTTINSSTINFSTINSSTINYTCYYGKQKFGYDQEYFWLSGVLLLIIAIPGFLSNIICLIVLIQKELRKKVFYQLLAALSGFDLLFILSSGLYNGYKSLQCEPNNALLHVTYLFLNVGLTGSVYMTIAISLERFLGICHPHSSYRRNACIYILPVVVVAISFNLPKFFEKSFSLVNGTVVVTKHEWAKTHDYTHGYYLWADILVTSLIPLVSLFCLNGAILVTIRRTVNVRQVNRQEGKTAILFLIVLTFLICHLPRDVYKALYWLNGDNKRDWYLITPVKKLALILNSSINFVIYCLAGNTFRKEFFYVFSCCKSN